MSTEIYAAMSMIFFFFLYIYLFRYFVLIGACEFKADAFSNTRFGPRGLGLIMHLWW